MASADTFEIVVHGSGGHASEPFRAVDPIPIACEIVQALQMMVTRRIDIFDPAVVTVGRITAGTTSNIIPETATIVGTIRTVSERTRAAVHDNLRSVRLKRASERHRAWLEVIERMAGNPSGVPSADSLPATDDFQAGAPRSRSEYPRRR